MFAYHMPQELQQAGYWNWQQALGHVDVDISRLVCVLIQTDAERAYMWILSQLSL